jgi:hypothetical protein
VPVPGDIGADGVQARAFCLQQNIRPALVRQPEVVDFTE